MRVLLLSRYERLGASSRVRSLQYLPHLESKGWKVDVKPLFSNKYIKQLYRNKLRYHHVLHGYLNRTIILPRLTKYDLIWIEKEIFPFIPAIIEYFLSKSNTPYIVDYDDAIFHRYDQHNLAVIRFFLGKKISKIMKNSSLVITGNAYLADYAYKSGAKRVEIIPTSVDVSKYNMISPRNRRPLVIGWIGSPSTVRYLLDMRDVFLNLSKDFNVKFVAVGVEQHHLPGDLIKARPWSEETEIKDIQSFDIGVMPLPDSPWERGKCGYKLIQYMSCGLPIVASPVGVNRDIVKNGVNGFLAKNFADWESALRKLILNLSIREEMGKNGRYLVEERYSLQSQSLRLESLMRSVVNLPKTG